jgi:diadenylate cyclase
VSLGLDAVRDVVAAMRPRDLVDIGIVAYVLYRLFLMFQGTAAVQMLAGLGVLMLAQFVAREADLRSLGFVLDNFWGFWVLALIVLFQPELRRSLAQAGKSRVLQHLFGSASAQRHHVIEELVRAVDSLALKRVGALVALERRSGLRHITELGVPMDAAVSAELLGTLFQPGSPLHDGAAVIQGDRIVAAGCFLPLSRNLRLARTLGTRHRAALGLSEETDAVVVVVSEETGAVSLAVEGAIERADPAALRRRLAELLGDGAPASARAARLLDGVRRRLTVRMKA